MHSKWLTILDSEEGLKELKTSNLNYRKAVIKILEEERKSIELSRDYNDINWAIHEADKRGQLYVLNYIIEILGE